MSRAPDAPIVIGRSPDCDLVIAEPSVSGRHARLYWRGAQLVIEDLGSANGVWVSGQRVRASEIKPGDDVLIGNAALPWSDPRLAPLLRRGARGDTAVATVMGRAYLCGRCGTRGFLPRFVKRAEIQCGSCGAVLELGGPQKPSVLSRIANAFVGLAIVGLIVTLVFFGREHIAGAVREVGKETGIAAVTTAVEDYEVPSGSSQETAIRRSDVRDLVVAAIDPSSPTTRNLAAQVAARDQGTFHIGQVASIWKHVREEWSYVNDPRGNEYFALASETITNDFVGDCDDFAILLVSMIEAVGGDARLVMSDGERGGHAYAEVCIPGEAQAVVTGLNAHYRRVRSRTRVRTVHFRSDETCAVWLNLDWSAVVPGGPYGTEDWAVAIHPDGKTETLAPAVAPAD